MAGARRPSRAECAPFPGGTLMHRVLILGAGKIGALISGLLAESGSYRVQLADVDGAAAESVVRAHGAANLTGYALDATQAPALEKHLAEHPVDAVISSLPYYCNVAVAEAARKARTHYFDLTEDVEVTRAVRAIAAGCGRGLRAPVRPRPGLHQHRRGRAHHPLRHAARGEAACRRPAPAPEQRAQVLPHLVDRRPDQRVRQPLPGDQRRAPARGRPARGPRGDRDSTARCTRPSTPRGA